MSSDPKSVLKERLERNYQDYMKRLKKKPTSKLILLASEITAAQQLHEELLDACDDDDIEFLLRFNDPLEVVLGSWEAEIAGYDHSEEMSHMLWSIRDRELFFEEPLPPAPAKAEHKITSRSKQGRLER